MARHMKCKRPTWRAEFRLVRAWLARRFDYDGQHLPAAEGPCPCGGPLRFEHCHQGQAFNPQTYRAHKSRRPRTRTGRRITPNPVRARKGVAAFLDLLHGRT